jgi:hypothetical protein
MSGKNHPNYGKTPSPETILKIKLGNINHYKNKSKINNEQIIHKGRQHTKETKDKLRNISINNVIKNSKIRIHQYDLNMNIINTYVSYGDASRKCNISRNSIKNACTYNKTSKGFFWIKEEI